MSAKDLRSSGRSLPVWTLRLVLCLGLAALVQGCAVVHHYGPEEGQVVEKGTGKPIEGVAVVRIFQKWYVGLGDAVKRDVTAQETLTNANGEFRFPAKTVWTMSYFFSWFEDNTHVYVFKPGYGMRDYEDGKVSSSVEKPSPSSWIFRLQRLDSIEQRRRNVGFFPLDAALKSHFPYFLKLYNYESASVGLEGILEERR